MLLSFDRDGAGARSRRAAKRILLDLPYSEPYNLLNTLAAVGAATRSGCEPTGRSRSALQLACAASRRACRRGYGRQRLLQRQPDVDAGGPPSPRRDARRAARGGARHDGRAGARLGTRSTARSARRPRRSGSTCSSPSGAQRSPTRDGFDGESLLGPDARGGRRAARGDRPAGRPRARQGLPLRRLERVLA